MKICNYAVLLELGRGGHSNVFLAKNIFNGTLVSIKKFFCLEALNGNRQLRNKQHELWANEAYILNKIYNEDGFAKIVEAFEDNNAFYIVTEYIKGSTLNEAMKKHLKTEQILSICKSLMLSVLSLHKKGIIHRDICLC